MILTRVAGVLVIAALGVLAVMLVRHASARDEWRARSNTQALDYDPAASDAAYAEVEEALGAVTWTARVLALALVAAGVAIGRERPHAAVREPTPARVRVAGSFDGLSLLFTFLVYRFLAADGGLTAALCVIVPGALLAVLFGLVANGASLGTRAFAPR